MEVNGCLHKLLDGFSIRTLVGNPSVLGEYPGWDMDECAAVLDACPPGADIPFGVYMSNIQFLQDTVTANIHEFLDFDAGTVNFDNPTFIQILELSSRLPGEDYTERIMNTGITPWKMFADGRQIVQHTYMYRPDDIIRAKSFIGSSDVVCKGFPTPGRDGYILNTDGGFAIFESSPHKEGAWEFIRETLGAVWQTERSLGFPTNKAAFDIYISSTLEEDWEIYDYELNLLVGTYTPTQADIDMTLSIIDAALNRSNRVTDETTMALIIDIISECASDFFGGIVSVEDAARIVQSRVGILVAERS